MSEHANYEYKSWSNHQHREVVPLLNFPWSLHKNYRVKEEIRTNSRDSVENNSDLFYYSSVENNRLVFGDDATFQSSGKLNRLNVRIRGTNSP